MSFQKNTKSKKNNSAKAFIDYKPAEIRFNSRKLVVYYYKHPITKKFVRVRLTVPKMKSKKLMREHAQMMVLKINYKLKQGWLPIYDNAADNEFKTIDYCIDLFLKHTKKDVEKNNKRIDSLRTNRSFLSMLKKYIDGFTNIKMIFEINRAFVTKYLDWIYYDRNNSPRTRNNHLAFLISFLNYCLDRGYVKSNTAIGITKLKKQPKKRKVFTDDIKTFVKNIEFSNYNYYTLCMMTYYCFIRRTELTKLKVKDVFLEKNYIALSGEITKNRKSATVTIPKKYKPILKKHLKNANKNHYLFSSNDFKPGANQLAPKKVSDTWTKMQKKYRFERKYQFYSLKDTGITDMLNLGIPAIKVRDQARHYDLRITEAYTFRNDSFDETIKTMDFEF